jgi:hypothetical protein
VEPLESYYARFWKRFRKDSTAWARDNILWGIVVLIVPILAARLLHHTLLVDWELVYTTLGLYAVAAVIYFAAHACLVPRKLDIDRNAREATLGKIISDYEQKVKERDEAVRVLSEKPKRTSAEQHAYDTLRAALDLTKEVGLIALRHLSYHGKLAFGTYNPELPPGLTRDQTLWVYNHCLSVGIVTRSANLGHSEFSYSFSANPAMEKALNELLFPAN